MISLLPQLLRLRHLADVEVREIDLVQQVIEQRFVSAVFEFCLQAAKYVKFCLRAADTVGMKKRRAVPLTGTKWSALLVIDRLR